MKWLAAALLIVVLAGARDAAGQTPPGAPVPDETEPAPENEGDDGDDDGDGDGEPDVDDETGTGAAPDEAAAAGEVAAPPVVWTEWSVAAMPGSRLLEPAADLEAVVAPQMRARPALTVTAEGDLRDALAEVGYHLHDIAVERPGGGTVRAVLRVEPVALVRRVEITGVDWWRVWIKEELTRRMRLRVGEPLEHTGPGRQAQRDDEERRLEDFLHDEGFFDARVGIRIEAGEPGAAVIHAHVDLGDDYHVGRITIDRPAGRRLALSEREIKGVFYHCEASLLGFCLARARFTRSQHQADLQRLAELYQRRGYPAARIRSNYDPATSFVRSRREVDFTLRIDERRQVSVAFDGNDKASAPDDELLAQTTFDDNGSADDLEVTASAEAIQRWYQRRGYFDASVAAERERKRVGDGDDTGFDQVRFRIDEGERRRLRAVDIVVADGEPAIPLDELREVLVTRPADSSFRLLGASASSATAEGLRGDVTRLTQLYRSKGYFEARVEVHAAPTREALGDAMATAALLAAGKSPDDLYVRFTIEEGAPTLISAIQIRWKGEHVSTVAQVIDKLGLEAGAPFSAPELEAAVQRLQEWYWQIGRPRVTIEPSSEAVGEHSHVIRFEITEGGEVRLGEVLIRGNFRTEDWVIERELGFERGQVVDAGMLTGGVRRLRATGLFSSVDLVPLGFEDSREPVVHVLIQVQERLDARAFVDTEVGVSTVKGAYLEVGATLPNLGGTGIALTGAVTGGVTQAEDEDDSGVAGLEREFLSVESSLRVPRWVLRRFLRVGPDLELGISARQQDTERFGDLTTITGTVAFSRNWQRPPARGKDGRAITTTLRYDFRRRNRQEDTVRVSGANADTDRTTITTDTGAVGVAMTWEQRVDAAGNLNPLAPDRGFKLEAGTAVASRYFLGQDDFIEVNGAGQWIRGLGSRLQLRLEGRYNQGFPLGGAVLLPEVERYFAGGDDTVRGFPEDRVAIEVIEHGVPPFDDLTQVEIRPAGGNIRLLGSIDLQVKLWRIKSLPVASALFVDAGVITNTWDAVDVDAIRPAAGIALARLLTPFGGLSLEYAVPLRPREHDPPQGRLHFLVALRY